MDADRRTAEIAAVSIELAIVFNNRTETKTDRCIFHMLQVRETEAVFVTSIYKADIIFTSATGNAIAETIVRTNSCSMAAKFLWKFSKPTVVGGVRFCQAVYQDRINHVTGIRCPEALKKGQFVDTYRGEIITNDEAIERAASRTVDQDNYLMDLDKFNPKQMITKAEMKEEVSHAEYKAIKAKVKKGDYEVSNKEDGTELWLNPNYEPPYVCDGMKVGGPTRFMNHSCEPNCRLFTVSYNHADERVYELAFFTIGEIEPGVELTFDYKDEDDRDIITDEMADEVELEKGYRPSRCLCGSEECRRYFFN